MTLKSKRSKATDIPQKVKQKVWERDKGICVNCKTAYNTMPNAHFIPRSAGGLGIEQNIVTLCSECHRRFDQTTERKEIGIKIEAYLKRKYPSWEKQNLFYKKGN